MSAEARAKVLETLNSIIDGSRARQLREAFECGQTAGAKEMLGLVIGLAEEDNLPDFVAVLKAIQSEAAA